MQKLKEILILKAQREGQGQLSTVNLLLRNDRGKVEKLIYNIFII